jgi:hypothetical protein
MVGRVGRSGALQGGGAAMNLQPQRVSLEPGVTRTVARAQPIGIVSVGATATTVYDNTGAYDFLIPSLWAANITGAAVALTLHAVPAGGSAGDGNAIMKGRSIAANSEPVPVCSQAGIRIRLQPGMRLVALGGTGAAINMGGWGFEVLGGEM